MSIFIVDVESDGPAPGLYSMVSVGIVRLDAGLKTTFYGKFRPISNSFIEEALAVSGIDRATHLTYPDPKAETQRMARWIESNNLGGGRMQFVSDNPAFDWQFVNYYLHAFEGRNPFGHSARRIGDLYAGLKQDWGAASKWKALRKTKHTHHPVDDAVGNAEALIAIAREFKLKLPGLNLS
jgi:hypothetical protein